MTVSDRLATLGIELPEAAAPAANYVPFVVEGSTIYVSGQLPKGPDGLTTGKLGGDLNVEQGAAAARLCAINLLAQAHAAAGDLDRVRLLKLTAFVNSTPEFAEQPAVINGASDLLVDVLGEDGRHARSAVSVPSLPFGVAVEIEAIFALK